MIVLERPIKFEEVDAAAIVFFARYVGYAHEAMEHLFGSLLGGYARLVTTRHVGFPAVHVEVSYAQPARYGDVLRIETTTARLGTRSFVLRYRMLNAATSALVAEVKHTVVTSDLRAMKSIDMPDDVRAVLTLHLEPAS